MILGGRPWGGLVEASFEHIYKISLVDSRATLTGERVSFSAWTAVGMTVRTYSPCESIRQLTAYTSASVWCSFTAAMRLQRLTTVRCRSMRYLSPYEAENLFHHKKRSGPPRNAKTIVLPLPALMNGL